MSTTGKGPAEVLETYFAKTMGGDLDAVDRWFASEPDYVLLAEDDPELQAAVPWAGRQRDHEGIKRAYGQLLEALEVIGSDPIGMVEDDDHVAIFGTFTYRARATGREATSAWAAYATVRDERIVEYRFVENSHAVAAALAG